MSKHSVQPKHPRPEIDIEELAPRFAELQTRINALTVLAAIAFCWITHSLLVAISSYIAASDGSPDFFFLYQSIIWWYFQPSAEPL